ncbi:malto-oligosyltrehalose trehalohydrolase [Geobacter sp.]|uniref:malto-oligosyltrehalose trehalohydrolase n=1 Tax=Geobacter sp. TaxID=46610 RepID=UPI00263858D4|nr:malto-oligosyltrehalose trehalohydrolase [Geobacter sp.]
MSVWHLDIGATPLPAGVRFRVWAPLAETVAVIRCGSDGDTAHPLARAGDYFQGTVAGMAPGDRYWYRLDGALRRPDPASRCQPDGVHGPSQVVDPASFAWSDTDWRGRELEELITYELHVGTFTPAGTFTAAIDRLNYLCGLGVTAVELMPVVEFPGSRNWGYDGVFPFAPHHAYGGAEGLKALVDACHRRGLAVILDVVYNHLGPEGNYLHPFGPYFTDRYRTPWGDAVNFDGPQSGGVRHYVIANALHWVAEYHVDGLRLDAIHGIFDFGACHILRDLARTVASLARRLGRKVHVIAESDLNDVRTILPPETGGHGVGAQWCDDFHHALMTLLTGERGGYYADFGAFRHLVKAFREGFVYSGEYSRYRRRRHGSSTANRPPRQLVVFSQNHDQVGNRALGDRPATRLSPEQLKLAAGAVLLSPYQPLLFMGEEYGETAPFPYFTSHGDPDLVEAVRRGRREEFASFGWEGELPDPQAGETFRAAKLDPERRHRSWHRPLFAWYRELIRLRRELPLLRRPERREIEVAGMEDEEVIAVRYHGGGEELIVLLAFGSGVRTVRLPMRHGKCRRLLASADGHWGGPGSPAPERLPASSSGPEVALAPFSVTLYGSG